MKELIVLKKYENKEIYSVILKNFPRLNNSALNKAFRLKDIKVNDKRVPKDFIVHENDVIKIYITDNLLFSLPNKIDYVYEDQNIIVAYKPKGIISNYETGIKNETMLYFDELVKKEKGNDIRILNRLDTNTEGLVIFSKNDLAYNELFNSFKENKIKKEYLAVVFGKLEKDKEILSNYIIKDSSSSLSKIIQKPIKNAKSCITEYEVLNYFKNINVSILKIKLHTGRTHQIRAHMKYINHPIIGDSKYSTNEINKKFKATSQLLYSVKYSFEFSLTSPLKYLNSVVIDVTQNVQKEIEQIIF